MRHVEATLRDFWKKKLKADFDPNYAYKHHVRSSDSLSVQSIHQTHADPIDSLVVDPVLQQARAEENYYSQQLRSGFQIFNSGVVETAADDQNLRLWEDSQNQHSSGTVSGSFYTDPMLDPRAPGYPSIYDRPREMDPLMMPSPGFGPMTASQAISMCLGGY